MLHQCNHFHSAWKYIHLCDAGQDGAAVTLCRHMSPFCKETEKAHFNPRAENLKRKSVQMPLLRFPWTWKQEWLKLKMTWEEWGTICGRHKKHEAPECYLFPLHYSASAIDPLSFASFCAGPPQRFPGSWDRGGVSNSLWIGHLLTICFSIKGECTGLVCSGMGCTLPYFCLSHGEEAR